MDPREADRDEQLTPAAEEHDLDEPSGEPEPEPDAAAVVPNDGRSYRIFQLRVQPDGSIGGRQREQLPKPVYGRSVALKWLTYYAKQLDPNDLLVLVDVNGAVVNVAQGSTGRLKPTLRREVRKVLAQNFNVVRERRDGNVVRRTSRPASGARTRRTSRRTSRR